jgi:hypothetical protein
MALKWLSIVIISSFLLSCGTGDNSGAITQPPDTPPPSSWIDILTDREQPLDARKAAALKGIEQDTCFRQQADKAGCQWMNFAIEPHHAETKYVGTEAVLIIDEMVPAVEMLRSRDRVLGFYRIEGSGDIERVPMEWTLPSVFGEIVTAFSGSPYIPPDELAQVGEALYSTYEEEVPVFGSHGLAVYNIMIDRIPDTPIVLLDNNLLSFNRGVPENFCAVADEQQREVQLSLLRARSETFAEAFRQLLISHNIRYINVSWGYTLQTVLGPWSKVCGSEPPSESILLAILNAYQPVFDALFNTPEVFSAHAAYKLGNERHFPFDQPSPDYPNRARIGVFSHLGKDIPVVGMIEAPVGSNPIPAAGDAEFYINSGCSVQGTCRQLAPLTMNVRYGMDRVVFPLSQTSFSAPLFLAQFINLRNGPEYQQQWLDDHLIRTLLTELQNGCGSNSECRYFDPLLYENQ